MDNNSEQAGSATAGPVPDSITWVFNPWRQNWKRPAGALFVIIIVSALAGYTFTTPNWWPQALGWGGVSLIILFGATAMIYLPVKYRFDREGVTVFNFGVGTTRKWSHYRNFYVHDTGVHLTTMPKPSALDPFRGHYMQFEARPDGSTNKAELVAFIEKHMTLRGVPEGQEPEG